MLAAPAAAPPPAIAAPAVPVAAEARTPPEPVKIVRYGLDQAELGMSLADWRAASPDNMQAACTPAPHQSQVVVCEASPRPAPRGGYLSEQDRRAIFVDGVLAQVSFSTTIDAFDGVMARLDQTFGRPAEVVRDTIRLQDGLVLPRVQMTWTNGLATIRLTDPEAPGGLMHVRATLNDDADRLPDRQPAE